MSFCRGIIATVLLAGAVVIHADIIYQPADFLLGDVWQGAEYIDLDLDSNGVIDFSMQASLNYSSGIYAEGLNQILILPSPPPNIGGRVAALDFGYIINQNSGSSSPEAWFNSKAWNNLTIIVSTGQSGEFINHRGFVGLEFNTTDGTHYGWLEIEGMVGSQIQIYGWAYESTPGVGIVAGAVPEPSSLILFLIGAWGTWLLRKEKNR